MIATQTARLRSQSHYYPLDANSVLPYLSALSVANKHLGGAPSQWTARECGDGNLNLVFVVRGPLGGLVVKQALPYVRMVGESWPLSLRRNFFEYSALVEQARWAAEFVPAVYHTDENMALIVMEFLTPHSVLRTALIDAQQFSKVGEHLALFLARTAFNTSELRLSGADKKQRTAVFLGNTAMCQISEDLIFDEPYFAAPLNWHTSPQLDSRVSALQRDTQLKLAAQEMKWVFVNAPECLIHGDLHLGSIMVTTGDTRVIDPEFAFYGPMGFDLGVLVASLLIAHTSQPGHISASNDRKVFGSYLLNQLTSLWITFASEFSNLWRERAMATDSNLYNRRLDSDSSALSEQALALRLTKIWHDALGFAGCEIIRRIVGLAHLADFQTITDPGCRAVCEDRAILLARKLLLERTAFGSVAELAALASGHRC